MKRGRALGIFRPATIVLALSVFPASALPQEQSWYGGIGFGQSKASDACSGLTGQVDCQDSDQAVKLFGGYQLTRSFALELGYTDLGEAKGTFNSLFGGPFPFGTTVSAQVKGLEFTGIGMLPLGEQAAFFARAGLFMWDVDARDGRTGRSSSASGTALTYGLGVKGDFTPTIMLLGEWQRYKNVGDQSTTGQRDYDFVGIGVAFKF